MKAKRAFFALLLITVLSLATGCGHAPMHAKIVDVAAGQWHVLALADNGDVYAWGKNDYNQLGMENKIPKGREDDPLSYCITEPALLMKEIQSLDASANSTILIDQGGNLQFCGVWMGKETSGIVKKPSIVATNITHAKTNGLCSMAITESGELLAWGPTLSGPMSHLGDDNSRCHVLSGVSLMKGVKDIALGRNHALALMESGDLYGWGWNECGQCGNGQQSANVYPPKKVLSGVKNIDANESVSAAITENGDLYIWGDNSTGQTGNGESGYGNTILKGLPEPDKAMIVSCTPVKVLENVESVSTGGCHTVAVTKNGELYAWGLNIFGQFGNGRTSGTIQTTPLKIMDGVKKAEAGYDFTVILMKDGSVYTCGGNYLGQLGNGRHADNWEDTGFHEAGPILVFDGKTQ